MPETPRRGGPVKYLPSHNRRGWIFDQHAMAEQLAQRRSPSRAPPAAQAVPFRRRTHRPGHPHVMTRNDGNCCQEECRPLTAAHLRPLGHRTQAARAVMPTSAARIPARYALLQQRVSARHALFTVFTVPPAGGQPPRERAIPRANVDRFQATPSYASRLLRLVKCPVSPLQPRLATPGR